MADNEEEIYACVREVDNYVNSSLYDEKGVETIAEREFLFVDSEADIMDDLIRMGNDRGAKSVASVKGRPRYRLSLN